MKLGERLTLLASFVLPGAKVADIGTDHGYLPIALIQNHLVKFVIGGEANPGPFRAAQESIGRLGLQNQIAVRFGDGLSIIAPGEVDTVVIAGMGGKTIIDILAKQPEVTNSLKRLILQPMIAASGVRYWLVENGWKIIDEALVTEEGKLYECIVAEQGCSVFIEPVLYEIGPVLWYKRPLLLERHIDNLIVQVKRILQEMSGSIGAQNSDKYQLYQVKLRALEEKKQCL